MEDQCDTSIIPNYVPLSVPITFAIVSAMLLVLPSFLHAGTATGQFGSVADIISATAYIVGAGFGVKAIFKLKEHTMAIEEYNASLTNNNEKLISEEDMLDNVEEIKKSIEENQQLKKSKVIEIPHSLIPEKVFTSNIDMDDKLLNQKVKSIIEKIDSLLLTDVLKNDVENRTLLENTKSQYLPKIALHYRVIEVATRKEKINNQASAYDMALQQINLITHGIKEVEKTILNDQAKEMRVMNRFLEAKFPQSKMEMEQNEVEKELHS